MINKQIFVWSDSVVAIKALLNPDTNSKLVWETTQELESLGKTSKITLVWVPRHITIQGNEMADKRRDKM